MIKGQARIKLHAEDLKFIVAALCRPGQREETLYQLLVDEEMRDAMLDHPRLLEYLLHFRQPTTISPFLYFYILVRQALKEFNIDEREVADYVANLLAEFGKSGRAQRVDESTTKEYHYLVEIMQDLLDANSMQTFQLRSHLGNYALFLTGIFPAYVYHRAKYHPPSPDFSYYESVGSSNYKQASQHAEAERFRLSEILEFLGRRFKQVRLALNYMTESFVHLDSKPNTFDRVLRRVDQFIDEQRGERDWN
jgi:hypothetical protein